MALRTLFSATSEATLGGVLCRCIENFQEVSVGQVRIILDLVAELLRVGNDQPLRSCTHSLGDLIPVLAIEADAFDEPEVFFLGPGGTSCSVVALNSLPIDVN